MGEKEPFDPSEQAVHRMGKTSFPGLEHLREFIHAKDPIVLKAAEFTHVAENTVRTAVALGTLVTYNACLLVRGHIEAFLDPVQPEAPVPPSDRL